MVSLDKFTFGKTPAAIYLTHHLNELNNQRLTQKISTMISSIQRIVNQLERANVEGIVSAHVICSLGDSLRERADKSYYQVSLIDPLAGQLMHNVMIGSVKELIRRSAKVRVCEMAQNRMNKPADAKVSSQMVIVGGVRIGNIREVSQTGTLEFDKRQLDVGCIKDEINPEHLIKKSKAKLERRKKINTLY